MNRLWRLFRGFWSTPDDELARVFQRKLEAATRRVATEEQISTDDLESLERLAKLTALRGDGKTASVSRAIGVAIALMLACLGVTVMLVRVREARAVLTLSASELGFTLDADSPITRSARLRALSATGVQGVAMENYHGLAETFVASAQLRFVAEDSATISLGTIRGRANTRIDVSHVEARPFEFRLRVEDSTVQPVANVLGGFLFSTGRGSERMRMDGPRGMPIARHDKVLDLTVTVTDSSVDLFNAPFAVRSLEPFRRIDMDGSGVPRVVSTLRSARLTFPDADGVTRDIHPSELVALDILGDGRLRELSVSADRLTADFTGTVRDLTVGGKSVMPTLWQWLAAQHAAALVWSTATYTFVTLLAVGRWWRRPV